MKKLLFFSLVFYFTVVPEFPFLVSLGITTLGFAIWNPAMKWLDENI